MKAKKLLSKLKLDEADMDTLRKAVQEAEKRSSGEIALAAIEESDDYSFYELFAALAGGIVVFALLIPFALPIQQWLDSLIWDFSFRDMLIFYGLVSFGSMVVFYLLANLPALDRLIIPRRKKSEAVYKRALRCFIESGVYATAGNSGILIFISLLEHEVRIIADSGVLQKIEAPRFDPIAAELASGMKNGTLSSSMVKAVRDCGELLAAAFPAEKDGENELADGLLLLED